MENKKVLVVADAHFSKKSELAEERWFPGIAAKKGRFYLEYWDTLTQNQFLKLLNNARKSGPFDAFIDLGDSTPGVNQLGLVSQRVQEERIEYQELIKEYLPGIPRFYLWGDHDVGYRSSKVLRILGWGAKDRASGMSKESFRVAEKMIGPPWQKTKIGNFTMLFLNSEIIRGSNVKSESSSFFKLMTEEQNKFVQDELKKALGNVILCIHDPGKLLSSGLRKILWQYQGKIILTLAGHTHLTEIGNVYRYLFPLMRKINLRVVPSPWGIGMPQGAIGQGGFAILEIKDNNYLLRYQRL